MVLAAADLVVRLALAPFQPLEILDGSIPARHELLFLFDIERPLVGRDLKIAFEAIELHAGALAFVAAIVQVRLRDAHSLFGEDARIVCSVKIFFQLLQLRGDPRGASLFAAQQGLKIAELPLE